MKKKPLTVQEAGTLGGKARWSNVSKKDRSEAMKKIRRGHSPKLSTDVIDTKGYVKYTDHSGESDDMAVL